MHDHFEIPRFVFLFDSAKKNALQIDERATEKNQEALEICNRGWFYRTRIMRIADADNEWQ